MSVTREACAGSEVLLALPPSLWCSQPVLLFLCWKMELGQFLPRRGLRGTSAEEVGGCECALKVLTAALLVSRIPRKLIWPH